MPDNPDIVVVIGDSGNPISSSNRQGPIPPTIPLIVKDPSLEEVQLFPIDPESTGVVDDGPVKASVPLIIKDPTVDEVQIMPIAGDAGPLTYLSILRTASARVEKYRAVWQSTGGAVSPVDPSIVEHKTRYLGISLDAASPGRTATVAIEGIIIDASWNWQAGPIHTTQDGILTQTVTSQSFQVAYALTPTMIRLGTASEDGNTPGTVETYIWEAPTASTQWFIVHNLGRYPVVTVVDSALTVVFADVTYVNINTVRIDFAFATGGTAYLV